LQRILGKFLVPENIPPHKAWDFLNNIRYMHSLILNGCSQHVHSMLVHCQQVTFCPPKSPVNHFYITTPKVQPLLHLTYTQAGCSHLRVQDGLPALAGPPREEEQTLQPRHGGQQPGGHNYRY
jgi:hypothetical protein